MHIVVTMAGLGTRFREKGFRVPKYQIEVRDRSLFSWSMESLRNFFPSGRPSFVVREEDHPEAFIRRELAALGVSDPTIVSLPRVTDGQATTVLASLPDLRRHDPSGGLLIYNIDTYVEPRALRPSDVRGDGWVPCFPGHGDGWSFFRSDDSGRVLEVKEKVRICDAASIGMYYFASLDLFEATYRECFAEGMPAGLSERYIAPMYQHLVERGYRIWVHPVPADAVHPLGTPEEVEAFAREP